MCRDICTTWVQAGVVENKRLYLVQAHLLEGRSISELAATHGVSRWTVRRWVGAFLAGGGEALVERSRRPRSSPTRTPAEIEDEILLLRKQLSEDGLDAGAETIRWHLSKRFEVVPSTTTIWRILRAHGFVEPQPKKRPRSSFCSFEAELPNEMWQSDMTHWSLADESGAEIVSFLDDCSRTALSCTAVRVTKATSVVEMFHETGGKWGYPASLLTDNGCIYTARHRNGKVVMESELEALGIVYKHGKPYHPQTQGKVERFQQTLKKWLARRHRAATIEELQTQLDVFVEYYNTQRPHKALDRRTPLEVWTEKVKAAPGDPLCSTQYRTRFDRVDKTGAITLRYRSKLHHIGMGARHKGKEVMMLVHERDIRIIDVHNGELIRHLELDPTKDYQPQDNDKRTYNS